MKQSVNIRILLSYYLIHLYTFSNGSMFCPSGLPYSVNQEQALQYPEVQKRLAQAISTLKEVTQAFCNQITSSRDLIPYAMLYMARVMQSALQRRFPHIPEKEILKVRLVWREAGDE